MAATATLVDRLLSGETGRRLKAEVEGEELQRRQQLVEELKAIDAQAAEQLPKLRSAVEAAEGTIKGAQEALKTAREEWAKAMSASMGASTGFSAKIGRLEAELRESADPAIDGFVRELGRLEDARDSLVTGSELVGWAGLRAVVRPVSNRERVVARLGAIKAAKEKARELQLEALPSKELDRRLAALRRGLPGLEEEGGDAA